MSMLPYQPFINFCISKTIRMFQFLLIINILFVRSYKVCKEAGFHRDFMFFFLSQSNSLLFGTSCALRI